jgi:hypothetical protein
MGAVCGGGRSPAAHGVMTPRMILPLGIEDGARLAMMEEALAHSGVERCKVRGRAMTERVEEQECEEENAYFGSTMASQ